MDAEDVVSADCVVSLLEAGSGGRGGRHVEFGMALALSKLCVIIGEPEHVLHYHPCVKQISLWAQLPALLREHTDYCAAPLTIAQLVADSHATAFAKGWWEKDRPFSEGIALMHSELSEALEEWRQHGLNPLKYIYWSGERRHEASDKPEGIAVEFADVLIRICDWCGKHSIPLEKALREKTAYNRTRPHRHGGKLA
jgi:NTP pyrophosphatase (non-canonical NTP hydrolase)